MCVWAHLCLWWRACRLSNSWSFWQSDRVLTVLSYFPNMHLTDDEAACSFKVKTPSGIYPTHSCVCWFACIIVNMGYVGGLDSGSSTCIVLCTWTAWSRVTPPPTSFSAKRELIYLGRNCGWANAAGWELFRVITPFPPPSVFTKKWF